MSKYNEERLVSSPVAPVPFGLYQVESDDLRLLKLYTKQLKESPLRVPITTSANVEEVYESSNFLNDLVGSFVFRAIGSLVNELPKNHRWRLLNSWVEYRKKGDMLPPSQMLGGDMSFMVWINIPYDIEEEMAHPRNKNTHNPCATKTQMIYTNPIGKICTRDLVFSKADEGLIMIHPSSLLIQSFPFYTSDEECIIMRGSLTVEEIPVGK